MVNPALLWDLPSNVVSTGNQGGFSLEVTQARMTLMTSGCAIQAIRCIRP